MRKNYVVESLSSEMWIFQHPSSATIPIDDAFESHQSTSVSMFLHLPHVGKYDRADDRPKLAMLAANVGYRYWTDDRSRLG